MKLNVYVDNECVYEQIVMDVSHLNSLQQLLLKNPLVINLNRVGYVPKMKSTWDGKRFSEVDVEDYAGLISGTTKEYYAIVLDNVVETIIVYSDEFYNAIMSSNPVFKLEDMNSGPIKMAAI